MASRSHHQNTTHTPVTTSPARAKRFHFSSDETYSESAIRALLSSAIGLEVASFQNVAPPGRGPGARRTHRRVQLSSAIAKKKRPAREQLMLANRAICLASAAVTACPCPYLCPAFLSAQASCPSSSAACPHWTLPGLPQLPADESPQASRSPLASAWQPEA
jgi:hypothetical protein